MNEIRKKVLDMVTPYKEFSDHKGVVFCIDGKYFENPDNDTRADFSAVTVAIEKKWLYNYLQKDGSSDMQKYLQEEYTSDDSYEWFLAACNAGKVAVVGF